MFKEPSTYAGLGLIFGSLAHLVASKGTDGAAWAQVMTGFAAIFMREQAPAV